MVEIVQDEPVEGDDAGVHLQLAARRRRVVIVYVPAEQQVDRRAAKVRSARASRTPRANDSKRP